MNELVESLKRLYSNSALTNGQKEKIKSQADLLLKNKKITDKEHAYIFSKGNGE